MSYPAPFDPNKQKKDLYGNPVPPSGGSAVGAPGATSGPSPAVLGGGVWNPSMGLAGAQGNNSPYPTMKPVANAGSNNPVLDSAYSKPQDSYSTMPQTPTAYQSSTNPYSVPGPKTDGMAAQTPGLGQGVPRSPYDPVSYPPAGVQPAMPSGVQAANPNGVPNVDFRQPQQNSGSNIQQLPNSAGGETVNYGAIPPGQRPRNTPSAPPTAPPAPTGPMVPGVTPGGRHDYSQEFTGLNPANDPGAYAGVYDPNAPKNAPPPPGWPEGLPAPPQGVLPGTTAYWNWLKYNHIDPRSPQAYLIQDQLFKQQMGGGQNPADLAPWGTEPGGYEDYMQGYLKRLGLTQNDVPDSFRQDIYGQIMGDAQYGANQAAGMIEDFDPTKAAGFDSMKQYMDMQQGYMNKYGGYMGLNPEPLQQAGIAQAEIARAAAQQGFSDQFAGSGLLGQANSAYAQSPMMNDYMQNRINAMTDPIYKSAQLGIQGVGTTMGALGNLYGLGVQSDIARAGAYSDLYGRGLATGAGAAGQAGQADINAFLAQQELYGNMPSQGYGMSVAANQQWNEYLDGVYQNAIQRGLSEQAAKDARKNAQKQMNRSWAQFGMDLGVAIDNSAAQHGSNISNMAGGMMGGGG